MEGFEPDLAQEKSSANSSAPTETSSFAPYSAEAVLPGYKTLVAGTVIGEREDAEFSLLFEVPGMPFSHRYWIKPTWVKTP